MRTGGFDALEAYEPFELAVFAIVGFELDIVGLLERWLDVEVDFQVLEAVHRTAGCTGRTLDLDEGLSKDYPRSS
jgi:hypothetical protein